MKLNINFSLCAYYLAKHYLLNTNETTKCHIVDKITLVFHTNTTIYVTPFILPIMFYNL